MTATANGRLPRKQLGDQLDRLDSILDCLADALNEAVADAARQGAQAAVKEILTEVLTNPQFAGLLRPPVAKTEPTPVPVCTTKPTLWNRLKTGVKGVVQGMTGMMKAGAVKAREVIQTAGVRVKTAVKPVGSVLSLLRLTGGVKKAVWTAVGVGVVLGLVCAACPHWLSAMVSAVGGAATALAVQVSLAVRSLVGRFRLS